MLANYKKPLAKIAAFLTVPMLAIIPASPANAGPETIGIGGALPDFKTVEVENGHVYDYTFTSAPTDWWVQSGVWEMTNRWSCSPGWSWFGGRSQETAAVWNKKRFSGDISVQFYFAFKMGLTGSPTWNYRPTNAAITICGDGRNLGSGYAFIVGADDNERSVLMKGDKVVAQSMAQEALLPRMADGNGQTNMNDIHRRWWYVRINKIGSKVECWLDNELVFTYNDSKPLDVGQVALWTYNNGIMLSRVQIYYENEMRPGYLKVAAKPGTSAPVTTKAPAKPARPVAKGQVKVASRAAQ